MSIISGIPSAMRADRPNLVSRRNVVDSASFAKHLAASRESLVANAKVKLPGGFGPPLGRAQSSAKRQSSVAAGVGAPARVAAPAPPTAPAYVNVAPAQPEFSLLAPDGYPISLLFYGASGLDTVAPPPPPPPLPTSVDTYWDMQPPAVRVLRNLQPEARFSEAEKLREKGYIIDYAIMVQGWNPLATMRARQDAGFTWVPSFMQNIGLVMPGSSYPGMTAYDPSNPPPRSIQVTTDFARGTVDDPTVTPSALPQGASLSTT